VTSLSVVTLLTVTSVVFAVTNMYAAYPLAVALELAD